VRSVAAPVERLSAEDLTSLATDVGSAPMQVGAVLVLDTRGGFDAAAAVDAVASRILAVPRLRQRLVRVPLGCGRPIWVDDADFAVDRHVSVVPCPAPGGPEALLAVAAELVGRPLPADRPLWSATFVTGVGPGTTGFVIVFHHVLADGIGGLAVLADLVDGLGEAPPAPEGFPRPAPTTRLLRRDAAGERLHAITGAPRGIATLGDAVAELRAARPGRPPRTSLNRPTGARRRFAVVRADLEPLHELAHAHGATVNDVVLTAVGGALGRLVGARGERPERFVASVPVSARRAATATELGNRVGVMPVELPATGDRLARLRAIASATRAGRDAPRGASAALIGPAFRLLARIGLFQRFIDRQRLITTFVTNLRGPDQPLSFAGSPITDIWPLAVVTGNVTVSFAVLSYSGTLAVTIITDPDACPDLDLLRDALAEELRALVA
jgi:diacylglycerol O-acyltransferase / wax synthase